MNSKTNLLNATLAKTLAFIQGKVADDILTSDETTEIIEEEQSHMKFPSQKKKNVVREATEILPTYKIIRWLIYRTEKITENPVVYRSKKWIYQKKKGD